MISLGLERRDEIAVTERGVAEDRRFFIVDDADRLVDQLLVADMVQVRAWTDPDATVLRLTFPDGQVVEDDVRQRARLRGVHPPPADPWGTTSRARGRKHCPRSWAGPFGSSAATRPGCSQQDGRALAGDEGLAGPSWPSLGVGGVDARRFRMLIKLSGEIPHEEDTWIGRSGRAWASRPCPSPGAIPRCAMTTHDPDTGDRDLDTLAGDQGVPRPGRSESGKDLMFGVYGEVEHARQDPRRRRGPPPRLSASVPACRLSRTRARMHHGRWRFPDERAWLSRGVRPDPRGSDRPARGVRSGSASDGRAGCGRAPPTAPCGPARAPGRGPLRRDPAGTARPASRRSRACRR